MLIILTLSILCIITTLFYVRNDKHSYYYGFDCIFQTQKLPLGICPFYVMEYPQRFILICDVSNDGYDVVIGNGVRYYDSFSIKDVLSYGYNDTSIVAKCTDSLNNVKYLISCATKYKNKDGSPIISFRDLDNVLLQKKHNNYQWYNVDVKECERVIDGKNRMLLLCILSILLFTTNLIALLMNKKHRCR